MAQIVCKCLLLPLLVWTSYNDIKTRHIPNFVHIIIFVAAFFINDLPLYNRLIGAAVSLPLLLFACKTNRLGGGDVKLIAAFGWCCGALYAALIFCIAEIIFAISVPKNKKYAFAPYLCGVFFFFVFLPQINLGGFIL